eukprot:TRINITY_DN49937_c0_g1_i2.p1 TRINITY_DN49937_c0_g1~~TRINITY_DN49937_c0_g1_i2.p1  ORF type:complete len:255 (-),score=23.01 TRINITY_DN49937_c0_g1_i2:138-848(-)
MSHSAAELQPFLSSVLRRLKRNDPLLTELSFFGTSDGLLHLEAVALIAAAVKQNTTLLRLSFKGNHLGCEGASHLSDALCANGTLTSLDLACCGIGATGAEHLAGMIRCNRSLRLLSLRGNCLDQSASSLVEAVKSGNSTLLDLRLEGNYLPRCILEAAQDALSVNRCRLARENLFYQLLLLLRGPGADAQGSLLSLGVAVVRKDACAPFGLLRCLFKRDPHLARMLLQIIVAYCV